MVRLGRSARGWLLAAVALLACASALRAQDRSGAAAATDPIDGRSPEQWLQIVQQAARRLDYAGTMVYQQGSEVRMSRIVHIYDGQVSQERVQPMDGRPREFIRRADEVKCLIPEAKRIVVERKARAETFPGLAATATADLLQLYSVKSIGRERVGGFECQVLEIQPRQGDRYGYRIWVDRTSGLLLRSRRAEAVLVDRRLEGGRVDAPSGRSARAGLASGPARGLQAAVRRATAHGGRVRAAGRIFRRPRLAVGVHRAGRIGGGERADAAGRADQRLRATRRRFLGHRGRRDSCGDGARGGQCCRTNRPMTLFECFFSDFSPQ